MNKGKINEALKKIAEEFGANEVELTVTNKKTKKVSTFLYFKKV